MRRLAVLLFLLFLAIFLVLSGCDTASPTPPSEEDTAPNIKIGYSMATLLEDRWIRDRDIFLAKAQQRDIDVLLYNANRDSDLQQRQVEELLRQDIDVLVIAPNDSVSETRCVQLAKERHIPVVVYDRLIYHSDADVYISFDNHKVGQLMGEYLLEHAPSGGYLAINGSESDHNSVMIRDGYLDALRPAIAAGEIEILEESWTAGWEREKAYQFTAEALDRYQQNLQAIICQNDSLAWGATNALAEARLVEQVEVVGMDADLTACRRIVKGQQGMTVYKPIAKLVETTLDVCQTLAGGQSPEAAHTIFDGTYDIPHIIIDVEMVRADNMDRSVIQDGFHLKEDIYGHNIWQDQ